MINNQFFIILLKQKTFHTIIFGLGSLFSHLSEVDLLFRTVGQKPKHITKFCISWLSSSVRPAGTINSFSFIFCLSQWFNFYQNTLLTSLMILAVLEHLCYHKTKLLCVPQRTEGRSRTPQGWVRWSMTRLSQQANHMKLFREQNSLLVLFRTGELLSNLRPKPMCYCMHLSKSIPSQAPKKTSKKSNSLGSKKVPYILLSLLWVKAEKKNPNNQARRKPSGKSHIKEKKSFSISWGNRAGIPKVEYFIITLILMQSWKSHKHARFSADKIELPSDPAQRKMKER